MKLINAFHEKQIKALKDDSRILVLYGAKRTGKTYVLVIKFLLHLRKFRDSGYKFIIGGATLATIKSNILDEIEAITGISIKLDRYNNFRLFGCMILVRPGMTSDSWKTVRGFTAYGVLMNEGTALHNVYIKEAISRCSGEGAKIFIDTNPENPLHSIKVDYIDKSGERLSDGTVNIDSIHYKLDDNTFLDKTYVESIKMSTPSGMFYDRDILGLWVNAEGIVYRDFNSKVHVIESIPEHEVIVEYVGGIDWGFEHYGSIVVFAYCESGNYYLVHEDTKQYKFVEQYWLEEAKKLVEKYVGLYFFTETARPEYTRLFIEHNIEVINADKSVIPGIETVSKLFKMNKLFLIKSEIDKIEDELSSYVWSTSTGEEKPIKTNDDCLDAVRYCLHTHKKYLGTISYF